MCFKCSKLFLPLVIVEFMDQREDERLVGPQILPQLLPVFRLAFFFRADDLGFYEVLADLRVQILPVGNDQEREITGDLPADLAGEKHHGIGLSRTLRMPENAQLPLQFLPVFHRLHQIVHAKILMVLGDDLVPLVAEHDEVFDVIRQPFFPQQTVDKAPHGAFADGPRVPDGFPVRAFLFGVHFQPLEEVVIRGVERAEPGLQTVGEDADLVERKQVRNVFPVALKVFIIRFLHLYDTVFQLDEDHRQTVNENDNVRSVPVSLPLDPHLGNGGEGVVFRALEVHQLHKVEILFSVAAQLDLNAVSDLVVILVVGGRHIRSGKIAAEVPGDVFQPVRRNVGIQARQSLPQNPRKNALLFVAAPRPVRQDLPLVRRGVAAQNVVTKRLRFQLLQDRLFDVVFGYETTHV